MFLFFYSFLVYPTDKRNKIVQNSDSEHENFFDVDLSPDYNQPQTDEQKSLLSGEQKGLLTGHPKASLKDKIFGCFRRKQ